MTCGLGAARLSLWQFGCQKAIEQRLQLSEAMCCNEWVSQAEANQVMLCPNPPIVL